MERFLDLRKTHTKAWFAAWALAAMAVLAMAQWQFSGGNPILTQVLGAQLKKPDVTPPVVSVTVPAGNGVYGPNTWSGKVSGTASDASGVKTVDVQVDGGAWDLASGTTSWSKTLTLPGTGGHTVSVRATDTATPFANRSDPVTVTFSVDVQAPAAPAVSAGPENPTFETSATFAFGGEQGARFECTLDSGKAEACSYGFGYKKVSVGDHSLRVVAIDAAGNRSDASAPWPWTVLINKAFGISGDAMGPLYPGMAPVPLNLRISNPYNFPIRVVSISVSATPSGACGLGNLTIQSMTATQTPIVVGANSTAMLDDLHPNSTTWPTDWPTIGMNDAAGNQDVCKSSIFTLSYTGTATKS